MDQPLFRDLVKKPKEIVLFNSVKDAALFYKVTSPCIITSIKNNKKFYKKSKIAKYV